MSFLLGAAVQTHFISLQLTERKLTSLQLAGMCGSHNASNDAGNEFWWRREDPGGDNLKEVQLGVMGLCCHLVSRQRQQKHRGPSSHHGSHLRNLWSTEGLFRHNLDFFLSDLLGKYQGRSPGSHLADPPTASAEASPVQFDSRFIGSTYFI